MRHVFADDNFAALAGAFVKLCERFHMFVKILYSIIWCQSDLQENIWLFAASDGLSVKSF